MSEEVAQAAGDIAYWKRRAEQAEALALTLQRLNHDAWVLIGRLDFFLETYAAQPDRVQRQQAAKLRREIKEASGK